MLHVIVSTRVFVRRLKAVAALSPRRDHGRPILETVQFAVAEDGSATLCATDLDGYAVLSVPLLKFLTPGVVQLPRDKLLKALKGAKAASFGFEELAPQKLTLLRDPGTSPRDFALRSDQDQLETLRPEDFPVFEEVALTEPVRVKAWRLCRLIEATVYATDPHCTRYALAGVSLEFGDGQLSLVATDGVRLAHAYAPADGGKLTPAGSGSTGRGLTPSVNAEALRRLAALLTEACDENATVKIAWTAEGCLHVRAPGLSFRARQPEGRFPQWRNVVPPSTPHRAEVRDVVRFRSALEEARKRISPDRLAVCLHLCGNRLSIETEQEATPAQVMSVQRPEGASDKSACWFSARLFEGWVDVVRTFSVELPETTDVAAVFRSDGLDFYVTPHSPDTSNEKTTESEASPQVVEENGEPEQPGDTLRADEWQDERDEIRPGPPDESMSPDPTGVSLSSPPKSSGAMAMSEPSEQDQGNSRKATSRRGSQTAEPESPARPGKTERPKRPTRTIRMGRIRAAIWANQTDDGILYNTTFKRIYKVDDETGWQSSDSFGPNDLLLLGKVTDLAHSWIMRQQGAEEVD